VPPEPTPGEQAAPPLTQLERKSEAFQEGFNHPDFGVSRRDLLHIVRNYASDLAAIADCPQGPDCREAKRQAVVIADLAKDRGADEGRQQDLAQIAFLASLRARSGDAAFPSVRNTQILLNKLVMVESQRVLAYQMWLKLFKTELDEWRSAVEQK
jgi:hypothetical protein